MKSSDYWRKREEKWIKQQIKEDAKQSKIIAEKYQKALDQIEKEISANWERFAGKEGVTLSDAKKMALEMDVKAFARKAKEYVDTKDFSKTANDELRLYNVTMRTNRLELLKSQIGLELIALSDEVDKYTAETLTKTGLKEAERQAGILGETVFSNYKAFVESVAFGSFQGATFSERIWGNNGALKADLDRLLIRSVTQGRNPRELARELRNLFDSSKYEAERLMRTETARMQMSVQQKSYLENDIDEFEFVAEPSACGLCRPLDGKTFKVSKMESGLNAAPMHPNCRCSTVPAIAREEAKNYGTISPDTIANHEAFINKLEPEEINILKAYTKGSDGRLNRALEDTTSKDYKKNKADIDLLSSVLRKTTIGQDITVYRGMKGIPYGLFDGVDGDGMRVLNQIFSGRGFTEDYQNIATDYFNAVAGTSFRQDSFMSTTYNRNTAAAFGDIQMELKVDGKLHGLNLDSVSEWKGSQKESEILLDKGYRIEIEKIDLYNLEAKFKGNGKPMTTPDGKQFYNGSIKIYGKVVADD